MSKNILAVLFILTLSACGTNTPETATSTHEGISAKLLSNTSWPYEVSGTISILDAGVGDSDYANWAIGSITVDGEDISIDFETSVLMDAGVDLDFNFKEPTSIMLGEPKEEYGMFTYPVTKIN